jgi:hypothetical protein
MDVNDLFEKIINSDLGGSDLAEIIKVKTELDIYNLNLFLGDLENYLYLNDLDMFLNVMDKPEGYIVLSKFNGLYRLRNILKNYIEKSKNVGKKIKASYKWEGNPDKELPELYRLMIEEYNLIASETTYEQFKVVFTGQPIDEIDKIERTKKFTNVLLAYFVSELFLKNNPNDYLSIAESCFANAKNLNQALTNYNNNQNRLPKNHTIIDELINELKDAL